MSVETVATGDFIVVEVIEEAVAIVEWAYSCSHHCHSLVQYHSLRRYYSAQPSLHRLGRRWEQRLRVCLNHLQDSMSLIRYFPQECFNARIRYHLFAKVAQPWLELKPGQRR